MRKVKNITVCVTPEIYRQTRHLAAEYDSTVSTIVAWLLERLPAALERTRFPKGGPKPSPQPAPAVGDLVTPSPRPPPPPPPPAPRLACEVETGGDTPHPTNYAPIGAVKLIEKIIANSGCKAVTPHLTNDVSAACSQLADSVTVPVKLYEHS
jgi:hypothetical protein